MVFSDLKGETKQEILGVVLVALAVLSYVGLSTSSAGGFGEMAHQFLNTAFGRAAWVVPALVGAAGLACIWQYGRVFHGSRALGWFLVLLMGLGWLHRLESLGPGFEFRWYSFGLGGGVVGGAVTWGLRQVFGPLGRDVFLVALSLIAVLLAADTSLLAFLRGTGRLAAAVFRWTARVSGRLIGLADEPGTADQATRRGVSSRRLDPRGDREAGRNRRSRSEGRSGPVRRVDSDDEPDVGDDDVGRFGGAGRFERAGERDSREKDPPRLGTVPVAAVPVPTRGVPGAPAGYEQVALAEDLLYQLPPLTLLDQAVPARGRRIRQDIEEKTRILEETLESFGVHGKVVNVERGPVVTCFEVQPAPGVKVARIVGLADDLALALAARDIRIQAPIPGKRAVGIEVPNTEVTTVSLREVLETPDVAAAASKLTIPFGKDISGRPITGDLGRLLHVLIAGATGSGKSVCINSIIAGLLFRAKPGEVKLLLIDPKVVELSVYEGIPHLVTPVVTDPKKAAGCLRWAVRQMEERYELFAAAGVRDIARYNAMILQAREQAAAAGRAGAETGGATGRDTPVVQDREGPRPLPYIVIVIDELADLMMVAAVDVEDAIWRLAQMARAAGIHLVVATQRPSVDVITGTIKANIPTRVAFAVSSQVDSRTIIDTQGAEKLLGHGDMLFLPVGATKPVRVQGAYVSDREIEALVAHVRAQARPRYSPEVLSGEDGASPPAGGEDDAAFEDAVRVVMETGQASISMLQRKLRVGYTRAGRLIDMMEEKGIVGPFEGSKAREILMTFDQYRRLREAARRAVEAPRPERGPVVPRAERGPVVVLPGGRRGERRDEEPPDGSDLDD